jgi:hypothetical protein
MLCIFFALLIFVFYNVCYDYLRLVFVFFFEIKKNWNYCDDLVTSGFSALVVNVQFFCSLFCKKDCLFVVSHFFYWFF